jgi:hypothetical protein
VITFYIPEAVMMTSEDFAPQRGAMHKRIVALSYSIHSHSQQLLPLRHVFDQVISQSTPPLAICIHVHCSAHRDVWVGCYRQGGKQRVLSSQGSKLCALEHMPLIIHHILLDVWGYRKGLSRNWSLHAAASVAVRGEPVRETGNQRCIHTRLQHCSTAGCDG